MLLYGNHKDFCYTMIMIQTCQVARDSRVRPAFVLFDPQTRHDPSITSIIRAQIDQTRLHQTTKVQPHISRMRVVLTGGPQGGAKLSAALALS